MNLRVRESVRRVLGVRDMRTIESLCVILNIEIFEFEKKGETRD